MSTGDSHILDIGGHKMKRVLPLAAIEVFVWFILLTVTFLISKVAIEISLGTATLLARIATQAVRLVVSGGLVLGWLLAC